MKVMKVDKMEATIALKEGQALFDLDHPNVTIHYEMFMSESSQELCTVMEYSSGRLKSCLICMKVAVLLKKSRDIAHME
jgi:hypothetical protein